MNLEQMISYLEDILGVSEEEIQVATYFGGYNEDTLNSLLYMKFGYRDFEQFMEYEDRESYNEYFGDLEEEEEEE